MLYVSCVPYFGHGNQQRYQKGYRKMLTSTRLTHFLKILSVTGLAVSIVLLILLMAAAILGTPGKGVYVAIWYIFFVGLPMYGILYVGLKLREYLREIETVLLKQQT